MQSVLGMRFPQDQSRPGCWECCVRPGLGFPAACSFCWVLAVFGVGGSKEELCSGGAFPAQQIPGKQEPGVQDSLSRAVTPCRGGWAV